MNISARYNKICFFLIVNFLLTSFQGIAANNENKKNDQELSSEDASYIKAFIKDKYKYFGATIATLIVTNLVKKVLAKKARQNQQGNEQQANNNDQDIPRNPGINDQAPSCSKSCSIVEYKELECKERKEAYSEKYLSYEQANNYENRTRIPGHCQLDEQIMLNEEKILIPDQFWYETKSGRAYHLGLLVLLLLSQSTPMDPIERTLIDNNTLGAIASEIGINQNLFINFWSISHRKSESMITKRRDRIAYENRNNHNRALYELQNNPTISAVAQANLAIDYRFQLLSIGLNYEDVGPHELAIKHKRRLLLEYLKTQDIWKEQEKKWQR